VFKVVGKVAATSGALFRVLITPDQVFSRKQATSSEAEAMSPLLLNAQEGITPALGSDSGRVAVAGVNFCIIGENH